MSQGYKYWEPDSGKYILRVREEEENRNILNNGLNIRTKGNTGQQ